MGHNIVRGTKDLISNEAKLFKYIYNISHAASTIYGYEEVITPIMEHAEVFTSHIGDDTDIVNKEMYFVSAEGSKHKLALRPEGTAAVVRAMISNNLTQQLPKKLFYFGPMFRHERPQKGRQRQFNQFGVECFGLNSPYFDYEVIALGHEILNKLGINNYCVDINHLGSLQERSNFKADLRKYLESYKDQLSEDSQSRLNTNVLRILDSKSEVDKQILINAPKLYDYLCDETKAELEEVRSLLNNKGIECKFNPSIVRGLDYYTGIVFEFITNDLGAQGTLLAGGRYNSLMKNMGGDEVPAVGFAMGIERIMLMMQEQTMPAERLGVRLSSDFKELSLKVINSLRQVGAIVDVIEDCNFKKQVKIAARCNHDFMIWIESCEGNDEPNIMCMNASTKEKNIMSIEQLKQRYKK